VLSDFAAGILSRMLKYYSFLQEQGVLGLYPLSGRCWMVEKGKTPMKRKEYCIYGTIKALSVD